MFINYLRIASRNIRKHKVYSLINIAGLSIGIACCIMVMLYVKNELSYDQFHQNKDFIYRVTSEKNIENNSYFSPRPPFPIGDMLKERFPQVKTYTIFGENYYCRIQRGDDVFLTDNMATVNPSFFEIFTFSFIAGDAKTALNDPLSVVITESFAKKLFNHIDVIGKTINIEYEDRKVTGVIHDIPYHSHLQFELVIPIKWDWTKIKEQRLNDNNFWGGMGNLIYVMLNQKVQLKDFNRKIRDIIKEYNPRVSTKIFLQPLDRVYLYSNFLMEEHEAEESADMITGDINNLYILSLASFGILLIACMNFMNLSTAIAGRRAKEIGLRKICGSQKRDILRQFLGESIILAFLSLVLALVLVDLLLPVFNLYTGKQLSSQGLFHWEILLGIMAVTLFTGLLSGSYPAFFLSSFNPVNLFKKGSGTPNPFTVSQMAFFRDFISKVFRKNKVSEGINKKYLVPGVKNRFSLRKLLIVFQFSIAIVIIICTTVFFKQLDFMQSKYTGLNLENTIVVVEREFAKHHQVVKKELLQHPHIISVTQGAAPGAPFSPSREVEWPGKDPGDESLFYSGRIDHEFQKEFKAEIVAGRFFSKEIQSDESNYILNETAVKAMGIDDSPIGIPFSFKGKKGKIIGVFKDRHFGSLRYPIRPIVFYFDYNYPRFNVKVDESRNIPQALEHINNVRKKYPAYRPAHSRFAWDGIKDYTRKERKLSEIFTYIAILTIFIACLGLLGLSAFHAERKTKEIGIRKVVGGSISDIVLMLTKEFVKWVLAANVISWPIAYLIVKEWLRDYAYRINIGLEIFIFSAVLVFSIAVLTVSYQAIKAGKANPVDSLRYE